MYACVIFVDLAVWSYVSNRISCWLDLLLYIMAYQKLFLFDALRSSFHRLFFCAGKRVINQIGFARCLHKTHHSHVVFYIMRIITVIDIVYIPALYLVCRKAYIAEGKHKCLTKFYLIILHGCHGKWYAYYSDMETFRYQFLVRFVFCF